MLNDFLRLQGNILVPQTQPQAKQQTISRKLSSAKRRLSDILKSLKQQLINTVEMSTEDLCMKLVYCNLSSLYWYHCVWPFLGQRKWGRYSGEPTRELILLQARYHNYSPTFCSASCGWTVKLLERSCAEQNLHQHSWCF